MSDHRNPTPPTMPVRDPYYLTECEHCGWVGSSEQCGDGGGPDHDDVICPVCCSSMCGDGPNEADTAKHGQAVLDRILKAEAEVTRLTALVADRTLAGIHVTPAMIAAAWDAWQPRRGAGSKLGPGPGFAEAIRAAFEAQSGVIRAAGDEPLVDQIIRLLDAIDNRYDPLKLVEPLIAIADDRYGELRVGGFGVARRAVRAEAVAALIRRGGHLPPRPVFTDDDP